MKGVNIQKGTTGQNTIGGEDGISALILIFDATGLIPPNIIGQKNLVRSLSDVATLGITLANHGAMYVDIVEFYKEAGEGTKLYLYGETTNFPTSTSLTSFLAVNSTKLEQFAQLALGEIKLLGFTTNNIDQAYGIIKVNALLADVHSAIPLAQAKANILTEVGRPMQIILPGAKITNTSLLEDFRDGDADIYENVSMCIASQDANPGSPAIGKLLGTLAKAAVNQNIGEVESFRQDNPLTASYTEPKIGLGLKVEDISDADQKIISNKGYIFLCEYPDYPGVYWSDDTTMTKPILDVNGVMNPDSIYKGRTLNKALRLARRFLITKVKKTYRLDASTGKITASMIKLLEKECEQAIDIMGNEISGREVKLNPDSNLLTGDKALEITSIKVVPYGCVAEVKGKINLVKFI